MINIYYAVWQKNRNLAMSITQYCLFKADKEASYEVKLWLVYKIMHCLEKSRWAAWGGGGGYPIIFLEYLMVF